MTFCGVLPQGLLLAPAILVCKCIFIPGDISQSVSPSLPSPELPVVCVKTWVHEPYCRDPQESEGQYQASAVVYT